MQKIRLNKDDLKNILTTLEKFPNIRTFELEQHGNNGIGTCLDMVFEYEVNSILCNISVPIVDVDSW